MLGAGVKRLFLAAAVVCVGGAMATKPADAQISVQLPFVSLGVGYPYYYPYYGYYGYPYYHRAYYGWGWRHRCHWWHYHCHWY
jgi:hypothetical protein